MSELDRFYQHCRKRDRARKWWQAKELPSNTFERMPILCTLFLVVWIIAAGIPAVVMIGKMISG